MKRFCKILVFKCFREFDVDDEDGAALSVLHSISHN